MNKLKIFVQRNNLLIFLIRLLIVPKQSILKAIAGMVFNGLKEKTYGEWAIPTYAQTPTKQRKIILVRYPNFDL